MAKWNFKKYMEIKNKSVRKKYKEKYINNDLLLGGINDDEFIEKDILKILVNRNINSK
jgi:hypothetical protein